jgi:hypothetical integral membrane protein (TIGR02206 family)
MDSWQARFFGDQTGFQSFSIEHGIPVFVFICSTILWIRFARSWSKERQFQSVFVFSLVIAFTVLWWMIYRSFIGKFDIKEDLPFHLCNILALVIPIALYYKSRWFFAVLYFWVLAGTMQAVVTPDLKQPFPHYMYFRYWWIHCGMISLVIYILFVFKWKIYLSDIKNAMIGANVYLLFAMLVNILTGGNYFFTMRKPDAATILDYLGPWPWYLLTGQIVMLMSFLLYYLPVWWWQNMNERIKE